MALPPGFLDELRARVSIAAVVGRKVTWDSRKTNAARGDFWAPCPFHQEKTASFHVEEAKGRYHCFGCHAKRRRGQLPARDREPRLHRGGRAARRRGRAWRCRRATRPPRRGPPRTRGSPRRWRRRCASTALQLERRPRRRGARLPRPPRPEPATLANASRSASRPTRAPRCSSHLTGKGFAARAAGRGRPRRPAARRRRPYDRFRNRIMFPIRDARGRGDRLRRPRDRRRAGAEVPELARDPALRQGPHALQPRPGARRRRQGRHA